MGITDKQHADNSKGNLYNIYFYIYYHDSEYVTNIFPLCLSSSSVRRAFDRLVGKSSDEITVEECQLALSYLGYSHSISTEESIRTILQVHRDITMITVTTPNSASSRSHHSYGSIFKRQSSHSKCGTTGAGASVRSQVNGHQTINFEEFCVISAYLSVLQQELNENTCVSPIKGTNLPPPPIFLTNTLGKWSYVTALHCNYLGCGSN